MRKAEPGYQKGVIGTGRARLGSSAKSPSGVSLSPEENAWKFILQLLLPTP